jgi:KDO2-lipid IV(A) lauroyltransferase
MSRLLLRLLIRLTDLQRRMLVVYFGIFGPRVAYAVTGWLGRLMYRSLEPIRRRSEAQCRAALAGTPYAAKATELAEKAFVHRIWNLTDLYLADRYLHAGTYHRYGGRIAEPHLAMLRDAQQRRSPTILLTGYYGPFDMLPLLLGFNGIHVGAVYLPHRNADFDAYRLRVRARSGSEMIPVTQAMSRFGAILETGGTVAIVADHYDDKRGMPVTFLGLPTRAMRSVGLLAWRYEAGLVVSGIRRVNERFGFEFIVADVIERADWAQQQDPVEYITHRYLRAMESMILADPSQYLWAYPRWGEDFAAHLEENDARSASATQAHSS